MYGKILDGMMTDQNYMVYMPLASIPLIVDNNVPDGQFFYCEPGLYDIWKALLKHPWTDKSDPKIDLFKVACTLFEGQQKDKPRLKSPIYEDPEFIMRGPEWAIYNPFKDRKR